MNILLYLQILFDKFIFKVPFMQGINALFICKPMYFLQLCVNYQIIKLSLNKVSLLKIDFILFK
jgi:hypothetical protein